MPEGEPVSDADDRGVIFMVLNSSIFRQFEFVHQQWVEYGNDAHQGSDKDALLGNHGWQGQVPDPGFDGPAESAVRLRSACRNSWNCAAAIISLCPV